MGARGDVACTFSGKIVLDHGDGLFEVSFADGETVCMHANRLKIDTSAVGDANDVQDDDVAVHSPRPHNNHKRAATEMDLSQESQPKKAKIEQAAGNGHQTPRKMLRPASTKRPGLWPNMTNASDHQFNKQVSLTIDLQAPEQHDDQQQDANCLLLLHDGGGDGASVTPPGTPPAALSWVPAAEHAAAKAEHAAGKPLLPPPAAAMAGGPQLVAAPQLDGGAWGGAEPVRPRRSAAGRAPTRLGHADGWGTTADSIWSGSAEPASELVERRSKARRSPLAVIQTPSGWRPVPKAQARLMTEGVLPMATPDAAVALLALASAM